MPDQRHIHRTRLNDFIDIYSSHSKEPIGTIVDISKKGIQITLDKPIRPLRSYFFYLHAANLSDNKEEPLEVFSHWCDKTSPSFYDAGFTVIHFPSTLKDALRQWA